MGRGIVKESAMQTRIQKALREQGCWVIKVHTDSMGVRGAPDILCCTPNGRFMALEVKTGTGRATEMQKYHLKQISNRNAVATVVRSVDEALLALHSAMSKP